jgi:hypothetical protein
MNNGDRIRMMNNAKLAELKVIAAVDDMDVAWSSYTIKGAKSSDK